MLDVGGFALTGEMREELRSLDLLNVEGIEARAVLLVASERSERYEGLGRAWTERGTDTTHRFIPAAVDRADDDEFVSAMMPAEILEGIVDWLMESPRG